MHLTDRRGQICGLLLLGQFIRSYEAGFVFKVYFILVCMYLYVCMCVCVHGHMCPWRPEEEIRTPGAGVTSGCELPRVDVDTKLWSPTTAASALTIEPVSSITMRLKEL